MQHLVRRLRSNLMLRGIACILGMLCWLKYSQHVPVECCYDLPILFYNLDDTSTVHAPASIEVSVKGYRANLYMLDLQECAVHLDAHSFAKGFNTVAICSADISLPDTVSMVHYSPTTINVHIE